MSNPLIHVISVGPEFIRTQGGARPKRRLGLSRRLSSTQAQAPTHSQKTKDKRPHFRIKNQEASNRIIVSTACQTSASASVGTRQRAAPAAGASRVVCAAGVTSSSAAPEQSVGAALGAEAEAPLKCVVPTRPAGVGASAAPVTRPRLLKGEVRGLRAREECVLPAIAAGRATTVTSDRQACSCRNTAESSSGGTGSVPGGGRGQRVRQGGCGGGEPERTRTRTRTRGRRAGLRVGLRVESVAGVAGAACPR